MLDAVLFFSVRFGSVRFKALEYSIDEDTLDKKWSNVQKNTIMLIHMKRQQT